MIEANRRTAIAVGAFVVLAGLLAAALLIFVGIETPWQRREALEATFPDASGLRAGAWVQLSGVNVGIVHRIGLGPPGTQIPPCERPLTGASLATRGSQPCLRDRTLVQGYLAHIQQSLSTKRL